MSPSGRSYQTYIAAASLVVGPLLMSIGDAIHPKEKMDAAEQAAIIVDHASRWYAAHLLLFIGMLAFIPGILALAGLTAERRPAVGYAARLLVLIGAVALSAVIVFEMLIGRFASDGADSAAVTDLLDTFQSGAVLGAVLIPAIFAFFAGVAAFAIPLVMSGGRMRWPPVVFGVGALFILAEILSAEVLLSQIGNFLILGASAAMAWLLLQGEEGGTRAPTR